MSKFAGKSDSKQLSYENIMNKNLDEGTIPGRNCLTDERSEDTVKWSDVAIKQVICAWNLDGLNEALARQ